jgi:sarcosine oxidase
MSDRRSRPLADAQFVVIGAGLLGLCTAWQLARRGREVAVLERAEVGHPAGGSTGLCRIFRLGYDDRRYVDMAKLALPLWRQLEAETGCDLLTTTGQLTFGPAIDVLSAALSDASAPYEVWPAAEAALRFPAVAARGPAVYEPWSGVIHARRTLDALQRSLGSVVHERAEVTGLVTERRKVRVETTRGTAVASTVVCCAGPGSTPLLHGAGVGLPLQASVEQVAYFEPRDGVSSRVPVLVERGRPMIYALPTPDGSAVKMGQHQSSPWRPPLAVEPTDLVPEPDDDLPLAAAVARLLPGFDPSPVRSERCCYDNSPDENFVVDRVGRIVVGAGTSGHGFKFGPLLGEMMADLAEGKQPRVPIDWLASTRSALASAPGD